MKIYVKIVNISNTLLSHMLWVIIWVKDKVTASFTLASAILDSVGFRATVSLRIDMSVLVLACMKMMDYSE